MNALKIKIIAIVTMLIDHIGHILFPTELLFRYFGRIAFPLFAFLIANGAVYTKNINKYLARLGILAIVSEPLFDRMLGRQLNFFMHTNIFYTLFLAVAVIAIFKFTKEKNLILSYVVFFTASYAAYIIANYISTDYMGLGVLLILSLYVTKNSKLLLPFVISAFMFALYGIGNFLTFSLLSTIPIYLYNEIQGFNNKILQWGFYLFYPAHILILIVIRALVYGIY
ncbi:MAG: conjugal transfer protein TraX [Defluviitaleaceae bacterium]|nr:conjugal transfer protein TraX [Defluviitaleaceae bacterium]